MEEPFGDDSSGSPGVLTATKSIQLQRAYLLETGWLLILRVSCSFVWFASEFGLLLCATCMRTALDGTEKLPKLLASDCRRKHRGSRNGRHASAALCDREAGDHQAGCLLLLSSKGRS